MPKISLQPTLISQALHAPLCVVVPVYNEVATIGGVVEEWSEALSSLGIDYQILLLNDGSTDKTWNFLCEMEEKDTAHLVIVDKPNSGHGRTCRLGYSAAVLAPSVEWVLQIDSDGQCDPAYFKQFWEKREAADCVFGDREKREDGSLRWLASKMCRIGASVLGGCDLGDANVPYRLMRREILTRALERIPASFDIHNVAVTYVLKHTQGIRWEYVPIVFRDRQGGSNSINIFNIARMGIGMLIDLRKLGSKRNHR